MSRGIKDVIAKNNTFIGTDIGLRFKTQIGRGGVVENIKIKNTYMVDIINEAIIMTCGYELFRMENESRDVVNNILEDDIPEFRNIVIEDLVCTNAKKAISLNGLEARPINNILFKNLTIKAKSGIEEKNVLNIKYENVKIDKE